MNDAAVDHKINWEDEAERAISDASRVTSQAVRDQMAGELVYRDEVILQSMETQKQIADAFLKQAIALQQKCEAMSLLYKGNTDGFLSQYTEAMDSTRESVRSAAAWMANVKSSPELYDSYAAAAVKIANADQQFSDRNKSGLASLFARILKAEENINKFIERSMDSARKLVSDVKSKAVNLHGALRSFVKNTSSSVADAATFATTVAGVSMAAGASAANNAINAAGNAASVAITSAVEKLSGKAASFKTGKSFKAGTEAVLNRQATRFSKSMDEAIHLGDTFNLENQLKTHPQFKQMTITGRNDGIEDQKNMMDLAIQAADTSIRRLDWLESGPADNSDANRIKEIKALERISKTIEVLDKHDVANDYLSRDGSVTTIREKMTEILKDHQKPQMRMRA